MYHKRDEGQVRCSRCHKPMSQWRANDECSGKKVSCWLCGGYSNQTCQCHDHPPGKKAEPCNMVCNKAVDIGTMGI